MNTVPTASRRATWIGLLAVLCWSCTVGLIRSVAESLGALGGAAVLYSVSAALVLAVQRPPSRAQWRSALQPAGRRWALLLCGLLFAAYEICLSLALGLAQNRGQALELGMINYLWPSLTIALAVACGQQRARWWLWPGLALCLYGLFQVLQDGLPAGTGSGLGSLLQGLAANPLAYGLALAAALMWPTYTVLTRALGGGLRLVGPWLLLTAALLWLQWLWAPTPAMQWSWTVALEVLAIGLTTALGYSCWEYGIQRGHLAVLAAGSYFTPVLSALLGSIWLAVQPGWWFWQGVLLVTLGSLVCWTATRR